jgi:XTP/dITP diphosphohydrolase
MKKICFASNNKHKLEEVRSILGPDFFVLSLAEVGFHKDLPETRNTFEENSAQKAEYLFDKIRLPCFADDSGLEVEALNGEPGVFSARYAGEHKNDSDNIKLLLKKLRGVTNRNAQFKTVITFINANSNHHCFEGTIKGRILNEERGKGGFGYDPVFVPNGYSQTFAEMDASQKNSMSHRAVAVKKLAEFLAEKF